GGAEGGCPPSGPLAAGGSCQWEGPPVYPEPAAGAATAAPVGLWAEAEKAAAGAPETTIPALASRTASVNLSASCRPSELFVSLSTFDLSFAAGPPACRCR